MKRFLTIVAILGLAGILAYSNLQIDNSTVSAQDMTYTDAELGITNDITTTGDITLPASGTVTITGNIASTADIADAGPFFWGEDSAEKIFKITVDAPTIVAFSASFTNPEADLDAWLVQPPADAPDFAVGTDVVDSSEGLGTGFGPESIPANVLLPGNIYFYALSDWECETCDNGGPFVSPATDYTVTLTVGGTKADVHVEAGPFSTGTLGRFTSGNGRCQVNRFSIASDLGLAPDTMVDVVGIKYVMRTPESFAINRANPLGDYFDVVAFSAPNGTETPPNNPTLLRRERVTITSLTEAKTFTEAALTTPLTVNASDELFAGMFIDYRDPGEANFNLGRNVIVAWTWESDRSRGRSWATNTTGADPVLSGWAIDSYTSGGTTGQGPMMFRIVVNVPGQGAKVITPGTKARFGPKTVGPEKLLVQ